MLGLAAPAHADSVTISGASFTWSLNNEQGGGAYAGGCNFLSAGAAGNAGSSHAWTQAEFESGTLFKATDGNVKVEKPTADGGYEATNWANRCKNAAGTTVTAANTSLTTGNRVVFSAGTGTVDTATNTGTISWTGSFTSVFYGGYTYWTASNPKLTVTADGKGTLTATGSGYAASKDDLNVWVPITPTPITLANLTGVTLTSTGFTVTPDYLGVAITTGSGVTAQSAKSSSNEAYWGSFPQDFADFQTVTGQSSYWYSSGGARDAAKPATPLTVAYALPGAPTITTQPASTSTQEGKAATFTVGASGDGVVTYQWQSSADGETWTNVTGATNASVTVAPKLADNGIKYRAVVKNDGVSAASDAATLTVTAATVQPTVTLSQTEFKADGTTEITVKGSGFDPSYTYGTRPPLAGKSTGVYVAFGKFASQWRPSTGAASTARPTADVRWAVLAADMATIGGAAGGAVELNPDGTFETTLTIDKALADSKSAALTDGVYGVYTYPGGGAWQPAFETAAPVSFPGTVELTKQPVAASVTAGGTATFEVATSSAGTIGYQWQRSTDAGATWQDVAGASTAKLQVPAVSSNLNGSRYRVVVTNVEGQVVSDAAALTVAKASPTLTASVFKPVYGKKSAVTVTVKAPAGVAAATGAVSAKLGSTTLATAKVTGGKAVLTIPATALAAGKRAVTFSYGGDADLVAATSTVSVTVAKAAAKVKVKTTKKAKAGKKTKVSVTVSVPGVSKVSGKVKVTVKVKGKTVTKTAKVKNGKVTVTLKTPKKKGKATVTAKYVGTANIAAKTSKSGLAVK